MIVCLAVNVGERRALCLSCKNELYQEMFAPIILFESKLIEFTQKLVIGATIVTVNKSFLRRSESKIYLISHSAMRADGDRDERGGIFG
jgi:hypothetical protein